MDEFAKKLNELITDTFKSILKVEETIIKNNHKTGLSINEVHLIEAVGKDNHSPKTVSELAQKLSITMPSVTVAVNKLVNKGFLKKEKSESDGRNVFITLTKDGERMNRLHSYFHIKMINAITKDINKDEKKAILSGIQKIDDFFNNKLKGLENKNEL